MGQGDDDGPRVWGCNCGAWFDSWEARNAHGTCYDKIYLVMDATGCWDDYSRVPLRAFRTFDAAEREVTRLEGLLGRYPAYHEFMHECDREFCEMDVPPSFDGPKSATEWGSKDRALWDAHLKLSQGWRARRDLYLEERGRAFDLELAEEVGGCLHLDADHSYSIDVLELR